MADYLNRENDYKNTIEEKDAFIEKMNSKFVEIDICENSKEK